MITRMFEGNGSEKGGCMKCLINPILLVTNFPG
jgi:hypothetical protein